ncbi:MAG: tripartite tricarboxylate transporter substrate binding protein, partial [Betaproteobacteria bacterium]|nr:tripartite tricarboxylate transporter substrate binding protein [Betaproteobacteria bacterium]
GGANDTLARVVAQKLAEKLGQPVIVDNRPGADGIIGTDFVAKSAPDGYTLLVGASGQMVFNAVLNPKLPYDPLKDFIPVTMLYSEPLVFTVHPSVPATSMKELLALAKAKPGALFFASAAQTFYVAIEDLKKLADVHIVHVPYKGTGQALMATVSGDVALTLGIVGSFLPQIRTGKLRPLAITGEKRDAAIPDVPTMSEIGLPMRELSWSGFFAPAATPRAVIDKLYSEMAPILKSENMKERYASLSYGTGVLGMTPAEFDTFYKGEFVYWRKVITDLNIRSN